MNKLTTGLKIDFRWNIIYLQDLKMVVISEENSYINLLCTCRVIVAAFYCSEFMLSFLCIANLRIFNVHIKHM